MEWLKKESKTFLPAIQAADEIHTVNSVDSVTMSVPTKENALAWQLWTLEARKCRSRARLETELSPQQVQRPVPPPVLEVEVGCDSQWGKRC